MEPAAQKLAAAALLPFLPTWVDGGRRRSSSSHCSEYDDGLGRDLGRGPGPDRGHGLEMAFFRLGFVDLVIQSCAFSNQSKGSSSALENHCDPCPFDQGLHGFDHC